VIFYTAIVTVVVLDQLTKYWVQNYFMLYESKEIIPGLFNLVYFRNTGAAFGMFSGSPNLWRQIFFIVVAIIALAILIFIYRKFGRVSKLYSLGLGMIAGGAIGNNLIDRVCYGSVVDFLDFYINNYHWPAFNVADSSITIGVSLLLFHIIFREKSGDQPD